jgi:hypothetical protein
MNKTEYMVYWTMSNDQPASAKHTDLNAALRHAELHRRQGMRFVTMSAENVDQVGQNGVDEVKDGKTPDGEVYDWNKSSRIGQMKRADRAPIETKDEYL